ncbi:RNA polymerase sigma factor [Ferdinandcohnia quinoae]|uniref:RNA polymerase sigma factor n=1 Tax=Fredinandcohnia quinoae TaxID=2918902 RepID=A0AAW5EA41_9BACI|nr:RNA polymerase sigma factor [Fredinandcohnia sp. SECRCQ15]MCH1626862.1 RNA polymerase sigma factor [Fredinandcohnia sp. SECRCQ15]
MTELFGILIPLISKEAPWKGEKPTVITAISDSIILKKIKKQDLHAVIDWFDSRKSKFYKIGWAYLKNHHDVEDVFHNTIIKVHDKIHQLKEEKYFETWVTSIFINECRDLYRKNKQKEVESSAVSEDMSQFETKLEVFDGLDQLDEKYKEVIILKYIKGFSQDEISDILKLPIGTVKSRLYRGLLLLRKVIEGGEIYEM